MTSRLRFVRSPFRNVTRVRAGGFVLGTITRVRRGDVERLEVATARGLVLGAAATMAAARAIAARHITV